MDLIVLYLIFLIMCGNSLSEDKKSKSEDDFKATNEWKEIREGQKVPSGLHYRINLSTGKKEAKLIDEKDDEDNSKSFTMKSKGDEIYNTNEMEAILKEVNKKNPEDDMPKKFRTMDEIKKDLGNIKLQPKSDLEILKEQFKKFEEEVKKKQPDQNVILNILQDLKYLGHQIDNGNEFYNQDGFRKIIYRELNSTTPTIKQETLKLFSVLAQNNPKVKVHILETGGITILLRILNLETNSNTKVSALTALSCTLRTFPYAQNNFIETGGLNILTNLFKTESIKLKLKIVTLLNDLIVERQNDTDNFEKHNFVDLEETLYDLDWCNHLNKLLLDVVTIDINDFDSVEKCLLAMKSMQGKCKGSYRKDLFSKLYESFNLLESSLDNKDDDNHDYFYYLKGLTTELLDHNANLDVGHQEL